MLVLYILLRSGRLLLINDNQGTFELTYIFVIDTEISLKWNIYLDTFWHVDKVPPDHTAELRAANLLSVGGTNFAKYCLNKSGYSLSAESVSVKIIPNFGTLPSCCGKPLLTRTGQKPLLNKHVQLLESRYVQRFL